MEDHEEPLAADQWYDDQLEKLINGKFDIEEVRNKVLNGERNSQIEKLLIGLLGWQEKIAD